MEENFDTQSTFSISAKDEEIEVTSLESFKQLSLTEQLEDNRDANLISHTYIPSTGMSNLDLLREQVNVTSVQRDTEFVKRDVVLKDMLKVHESYQDANVKEKVQDRMKKYHTSAEAGKEVINRRMKQESTSRLNKTRKSRMSTSVEKLRTAREKLTLYKPENLSPEKRISKMESVFQNLHSSDRYFAEAVALNTTEENVMKIKADLAYRNNLNAFYQEETGSLKKNLLSTIKSAGLELNNKTYRTEIDKQKELYKKTVFAEQKNAMLFNYLENEVAVKTGIPHITPRAMPSDREIKKGQEDAWAKILKEIEIAEKTAMGQEVEVSEGSLLQGAEDVMERSAE